MAVTPTKKAKKTPTKQAKGSKKDAPKVVGKAATRSRKSTKPADGETPDAAPKRKPTTRSKAAKNTSKKPTTQATRQRTTRSTKSVTSVGAAPKPSKKTTTRAQKSTTAKASTDKPSTAKTGRTTQARKKSVEVETVAADSIQVVDSANLSEQFTEENTAETEATIDRRKNGGDRRNKTRIERPKIERRAKVNRRRQIDPTTCERDYTADEIEFMNALELYKRKNGRPFPTCSEVLEVIRDLGYQKPIAGELIDLKDEKESPFVELPSNDLEERLNQPTSSWIDRIGGEESQSSTPELIGNS